MSINEKLLEWRQGDYAIGCTEIAIANVPEDSNEQFSIYLDCDCVGHVLISQTCDVVRSKEDIPNVVVAPLLGVQKSIVDRVRGGKSPRLALVENTDQNIIVDLGRLMSIRKQLLTSWTRVEGFKTSESRLKFARAVERAYGRFAFPDAFNLSIKKLQDNIFKKYKSADSPLGKAIRSIDEIRVIAMPSWDAKCDVKVQFLLFFDYTSKESTPIEVFEQFRSELGNLDWQPPFSTFDPPVRIGGYGDFTAQDYAESVSIDQNHLSFAARYYK